MNCQSYNAVTHYILHQDILKKIYLFYEHCEKSTRYITYLKYFFL